VTLTPTGISISIVSLSRIDRQANGKLRLAGGRYLARDRMKPGVKPAGMVMAEGPGRLTLAVAGLNFVKAAGLGLTAPVP